MTHADRIYAFLEKSEDEWTTKELEKKLKLPHAGQVLAKMKQQYIKYPNLHTRCEGRTCFYSFVIPVHVHVDPPAPRKVNEKKLPQHFAKLVTAPDGTVLLTDEQGNFWRAVLLQPVMKDG